MIAVYLDEDSKDSELIAAIRRRGWDVLTSGEAGMDGESDEVQLEFATARGRTIVTANVHDFARIHGDWLRTGRTHSGIVVWFQGDHSISVLIRGVLRIMEQLGPSDVRDEVVWLSRWI